MTVEKEKWSKDCGYPNRMGETIYCNSRISLFQFCISLKMMLGNLAKTSAKQRKLAKEFLVRTYLATGSTLLLVYIH